MADRLEAIHTELRPGHPWPCACLLVRRIRAAESVMPPGWRVVALFAGAVWKATAVAPDGVEHAHGRGDTWFEALRDVSAPINFGADPQT